MGILNSAMDRERKQHSDEIADLEYRIAELEALLTRVQVCMGVKRLPDTLMEDIKAALLREGE